MIHSAEEICSLLLEEQGVPDTYRHDDVRRGFIFSFAQKPDIDLEALDRDANKMIEEDIPIWFRDEEHISIGPHIRTCSGPRMHVKSTGEIQKITINKELLQEPITDRYLLVCIVGEHGQNRINDLNNFFSAY